MVMIGTDSHKRTHTVVAVDDVGRRLATKTVRTNSDGHLDMVRWSEQFDDVVFALEDCRHLTRRLESDLLIAGYRVVRVPTRLMAAERRGTKEPGKSDPIDAEAVALAALRYPDLPVAELEGPAREVKLLSDHRRDLVVQRTRIASQVRWFVHELDPDRVVPSRGLRRQCVLSELQEALSASAGKVRLNRGGNRATNCALHMIAVTQARGIGPGHAYLAKQQARGKEKTASLRLLRRRLSDAVFAALRAAQTVAGHQPVHLPAAA
jgi:transposase